MLCNWSHRVYNINVWFFWKKKESKSFTQLTGGKFPWIKESASLKHFWARQVSTDDKWGQLQQRGQVYTVPSILSNKAAEGQEVIWHNSHQWIQVLSPSSKTRTTVVLSTGTVPSHSLDIVWRLPLSLGQSYAKENANSLTVWSDAFWCLELRSGLSVARSQ